jgi:diguanylate cyclase (GGDEF)-like protein
MTSDVDVISRSSRLIEHLVRLSGLRRRDDLLSGLTQALAETTRNHRIAIFSLVHDGSLRFWLPLTQVAPGSKVQFVSDPMRTHIDSMAPIESEPERLQCINQVEMIVTTPTPDKQDFLTRFPMTISEGATLWGVAEISSASALDDADQLAAKKLITIYGNMLDMLDYSECDALTGLWNRKPFDDLFYKTLKPIEPSELPPDGIEHRAQLSPSHFWLAMLDIDHFKQVNDTYGHLIGDEVLILVARLMQTTFRVYDKVYRFGGEEFVVVVRSGDHDSAVAALERFRASMEAYQFPQAGRITVSVGLTEILAGDTPAAACERADQAVYYAKHHGRNQVCSEADLVRRGLLTVEAKVGDIELF